MSKRLTPNQMLGEIGEAAARLRFLTIGFQFDTCSRLKAGIDGIAEVMDQGRPLARMIAVQVKATEAGRYVCSSSDDLRLIRHFEKGGSGSSGLEFKRPAVGAASGGLRW